jgi:hypothetical protein
MNEKFDAVTRRGVLKKFGLGLAGIALVTLSVLQSPAAELYVDANAAAGGNGSAVAPYRRITDAVERARLVRQSVAIPASERIVIHIAAGNYVGTFNSNPLENNGSKEVLPIILNVSGLTLTGASVLDHDSRGLPTGSANGPQTKLKSSNLTDGARQALLWITRTIDGGAGDGVIVSGVTFGESSGGNGLGIVTDRVVDFALLDNAFIHTSIGIITRLSSGVVDGNYFDGNSSVGPGIGGGSVNHPASVTLSRNRSTAATGGADIRGEPSLRTLDLGANSVQPEPLQRVFDRNNPEDAANIPDSLDVLVSNNDFSGNAHAGLWCFAYAINPAFGYTTIDASQPKTSVVRATIVGNTFINNGNYGVSAEAGGTVRADPREWRREFAATFMLNTFQGNGRAGALFSFTAGDVSLGSASIQNLTYLQNSTCDVTDLDGELAGFDYDNPAADPISAIVLHNALSVNGTTVLPGTKITSLKK